MKGIAGMLVLLLVAMCAGTAAADERFDKALEKAARKSNLMEPGSAPFHVKLVAENKRQEHPEYSVEIEMWWSSPEKWRREVRSPGFTQTSVRNGERYYEDDSSDYLPWWLDELIRALLEPVAVEDLKVDDLEFHPPCGGWQSEYRKDGEGIALGNRMCFNPDDTVSEIFTSTIAAQLGNYQSFGGKRVAGTIVVWPQSPNEVRGTVAVLEKLKGSEELFAVPKDTGLAARLRFVSVPESAVELDGEKSRALEWPVVHNFPVRGVMAVSVKIDREGNVREVGTIVSSNHVLIPAAAEQIQRWKFKPYVTDGAGTQVNTTLTIPYTVKMELLGAHGETAVAEPFLNRIKKSREMSDPRSGDAKPFHLIANFDAGGGRTGRYEETWRNSKEWDRQAAASDSRVTESCTGGQSVREFGGPEAQRRLLEIVLNEMDGRLPDRKYAVYEADWGQSAVRFDGEEMVRIARGQVDADNQPTSGQAYWFDTTGLLRGAYERPTTAQYSAFEEWNGKRVPRKITLTYSGKSVLVIVVEKIETPGPR